MTSIDAIGYVGLFGDGGTALTETEWIELANDHRPPNLAAFGARFLDGSRDERLLTMSYRPGAGASNFTSLSGGSIAEMLDQTATHCGSLVTGLPCPTVSMTVTILRAGRTPTYLATGRVLKLTRATAVLGADLDDDSGRRIASASVVSQLITDLSRLA